MRARFALNVLPKVMKGHFSMQILRRFCLIVFAIGSVTAQEEPDSDPYAKTSVAREDHGSRVIQVRPDEVNVLSGHTAIKQSVGVKPYNANFMFLWAQGRGAQFMEWQLEVPEAGEYEVTALVKAGDCGLTLKTDSQSLSRRIQEEKWNRVDLGTVTLVAGVNLLRLEFDSKSPFKISSLELVRPKIKEALLADALAFRKSPAWFKNAGHGVMFQWTNRATPPKGAIKAWEEKVNAFDLNALVNVVEDSGASFVVWSVTWGQQYLSAPNKSLDALIAGRTTQRDLLGELAERLHAKGIRLIFYYHYGYDCYHSQDPAWLRAVGGDLPDKTKLYENIMRIVSEIGQRYGDKLDGWFFDGGHRYYDAHFDGSSTVGISSAPFKQLGLAARAGNSERVICYNPWILPRLTEYQDYFAGEGQTSYGTLREGVFTNGAQKGLMGFGCFRLEGGWGHLATNKSIAVPKLTPSQVAEIIKQARVNQHPVAINLEMYEDGSVSPQSAKVLKEVHRSLESLSKVAP